MSEQSQKPLDRAAFLGMCHGRKPRVESVTLPSGDTCYVRVMDGFELDSWQDGNYAKNQETGEWESQPNARGRLAARCLCDRDGKRLFQDKEADHLGRLDGPTLDAICRVARDLNDLGAESVEKKSKPSPTTQTECSGTDSPPTSA